MPRCEVSEPTSPLPLLLDLVACFALSLLVVKGSALTQSDWASLARRACGIADAMLEERTRRVQESESK